MKINAAVTILVDRNGATIEVMDRDSRARFVHIVLTSDQLCAAFGRLADVPCESCEVRGLDNPLESSHNET